ncbi:MarR family transcriptional regulator [Desulfobacter sp.]
MYFFSGKSASNNEAGFWLRKNFIKNANGQVKAAEITRAVSSSQATITGIFERLEKRSLITRKRSRNDRRRILVQPTLEASRRLAGAPP